MFHIFNRNYVPGILSDKWWAKGTPLYFSNNTSWNAVEKPSFSGKKKINACHSTGEVVTSVFQDAEGVIHVEFMPRATTIDANAYRDTLRRLRDTIHRKRPGHLSRGVTNQHKDVVPHSARRTRVIAVLSLGTSGTPTSIVLTWPLRPHFFGSLKQDVANSTKRGSINGF